MTETSAGPAGGNRGSSLRVRLLLGLAVAVVVPFVLFWYVGDSELRRSTKANLGKHLLNEMARRTAERIGSWLERARSSALKLCATSELRSLFGATGTAGDFRRFHARVSDLVGELGDLVLVSQGGSILFQKQDGDVVVPAGGRLLGDGPLRRWLDAAAEGSPLVFPPEPNPLAPSESVSAPQDPEKYVLPLVVPILDDTQVLRGGAFFLLPFARIQDEIEATRVDLVEEKGMQSGEVWLIDRQRGRNLLHTDRSRIAGRAENPELEGFAEEPDGYVVAASPIATRTTLEWSAGIRVAGPELFRFVDSLAGFFLGLVVLVLAATIGIASLISVAATRSLGRLERVTERLGAGDLGARADVGGPREVRKLSSALNAMASQLEAERERLKVAERDRAWAAMARQVAHEIKNPLQPVKLHAELILRLFGQERLDPAGAERVRASAGVILRQVNALQRIVQDFSEYAQAALPIGQAVRFRAGDVMHDLVLLYSAGGVGGVDVGFRDESRDVELLGSPLRLQQVLVNLIKNAIEASESGGEVEVTASADGAEWVAEVLDRGSGLPEGGARQAFEPSYSTKAGGTGLGLAICRRNTEAMGGTVRLFPREGGGVRARVEIPRAPEEVAGVP